MHTGYFDHERSEILYKFVVEASSFEGLKCLVRGPKGLEYRFIVEEVLEDPQFAQLLKNAVHSEVQRPRLDAVLLSWISCSSQVSSPLGQLF